MKPKRKILLPTGRVVKRKVYLAGGGEYGFVSFKGDKLRVERIPSLLADWYVPYFAGWLEYDWTTEEGYQLAPVYAARTRQEGREMVRLAGEYVRLVDEAGYDPAALHLVPQEYLDEELLAALEEIEG